MAKRSKKKKAARRTTGSSRGGLSHLQKRWEGSEPWSGGGGWNPPEGTHEAIIGSAIISKSQKGNEQIDWPFVMAGDKFEGKEFHDYQQLDAHENSLNYVNGRLSTLGINVPDDINDLGDALEAAEGLRVRFTCWQDDEFFNMRIDDVLEEGSDDSPAEDKPAEATYTKKQIKAMGEDELSELADEQGLNPDDYNTWDLLADEIIDELGL